MRLFVFLISIIIAALQGPVAFAAATVSDDFENLFVTQNPDGDTLRILLNDMHSTVIDGVYSIERDDKNVVIRTKNQTPDKIERSKYMTYEEVR